MTETTRTTTRTARKAPARKTAAKRATARKATSPVPDGVKQPADRQPPATAAGVRTIEVDGIVCVVNPEVLDDFEIVEALQTGNFLPAIGMLFDAATLAQIKAQLRDPDSGRIKYSAVVEFTTKVLGQLRPNS